ncbi:hypothetical protein LO762_25815 [Actinocorallia sp. API 0066]|uniref:hypothetical protein n=1 Tax=Actinocorallia sp. API 0066 TaxID=2896846 RepID=UPI001E38836E|nr:hypothetical protein [Actinocorallia sp. API 0066]MCD0452574.1 hypothetical protein [Actinocorallia sp. API 0066]
MADRPLHERPREIAVSKLLLDQSNPRLGAVQPNQRSTEIELAKLLDNQLFELANDVVKFGMDPSVLLIAVPAEGSPGKYRILEGNRRLLTVKALTKPKILAEALAPARYKRLVNLSERFHVDPIRRLRCIVFELEEDADHWIELRHTGENGGAGLVGWDSNEKARWKSRRGGLAKRTPAGQVIDFVDHFCPPNSGDARRIFSTVQRIVSSVHVRKHLGIHTKSGVVYSYFPATEVLKSLSKVVIDLRTGVIKVTDVYHATQRDSYINGFGRDDLPNPETRLDEPVILVDLIVTSAPSSDYRAEEEGHASDEHGVPIPRSEAAPEAADPADAGAASVATMSADATPGVTLAPPTGASRSRVKVRGDRTTLIPAACALWIPQARINAIYNELCRISVDNFSNACGVSLRVFVELTVDHHISLNGIMSESERNSSPLAKRMKKLAEFLRAAGHIDMQLERAIIKIADGVGMFSASTTTFNQYVHNGYVFPHPSELRLAWDELEPFMLALWKK